MLKLIGYKKRWVVKKGKARKIVKPVYKDIGKGAGIEKSNDPGIIILQGESVRI